MNFDSLTDEEYFAEMKLMFLSSGWKILMSELLDQAEVVGDIQDIHDANKLWFAKGQLATIGHFLNFEDSIERLEAEEE